MDDRLLIDGNWVATTQTAKVLNPYTGELIANVAQATPADMERAIAAAHRCFLEVSRWPRHRRSQLLAALVGRLTAAKEEIARLIMAEAGKPLQYARAEVDRAISTFTIAAEEAKRMIGEAVPMDASPAGEGYVATTIRVPVGPVGAIAPFNFPLNLVAHKVAPALAVGATVVLKPPPQAPLTSLYLARLLQEAGAPAGLINVLPSSVEVAEQLVADDRIGMLSFTGSARVGWLVKSKAGKKRVLLELGGNAAGIVHEDADLDWAAKRLAVSAFAYAGQVCISAQRLFIHQPIYDRFMERFMAEVKQLAVGDPADLKTVVGPMIDSASADRVESWVKEAVSHGAKTVLAGTRKGNLLSPIILSGVDPRTKVSCEEVFGPVVIVAPYRTFDDAVAAANDSAYGLQAGVFTSRIDQAYRAFAGLQVGGVIINDYPMFRVDQMPYGGVKESGLGREGVRYAMDAMTEPRLMVVRLGESLGL